MSEPTPFNDLLPDVIADLAPDLLAELQGWKFCRNCGGVSTWSTCRFDSHDDNLICPHCDLPIIEWPPGTPITCDCGRDVSAYADVYKGWPVAACCGLVLEPPDDFAPQVDPAALRFAPRGPGVEGAGPLSGESRSVRSAGDDAEARVSEAASATRPISPADPAEHV